MKRDERKIALRCAVYTRVSTDSGLEQDFNSLDNQREASGVERGDRLRRQTAFALADRGNAWDTALRLLMLGKGGD